MKRRVEKFIRNCLKCYMYSGPVRAKDCTLHSIPKASVPFDTIHIDHYSPLPSVNSKRKHILVVADGFTKCVKLYPVVSTGVNEVISSLDRYFEYYSRPRRIVTDRGRCFVSAEFERFASGLNIELVRVATASPQANGQVERVNRVLTPMLSKWSKPLQHANWVEMLRRVEYTLNNSVHQTTRCTPSELLYGVRQRGESVDWLGEYLSERREGQIERNLEELRSAATAAIAQSQHGSQEYHLARHRPAKVFEEGEYVVIRNVDTTIGKNKKFVPKFRGPYVVHKVLANDRYVRRDIENYQVTQMPYDGVIESAHIRRWADHLGMNLDCYNASEEQHLSDEGAEAD